MSAPLVLASPGWPHCEVFWGREAQKGRGASHAPSSRAHGPKTQGGLGAKRAYPET
jgi:hypothetical protein